MYVISYSWLAIIELDSRRLGLREIIFPILSFLKPSSLCSIVFFMLLLLSFLYIRTMVRQSSSMAFILILLCDHSGILKLVTCGYYNNRRFQQQKCSLSNPNFARNCCKIIMLNQFSCICIFHSYNRYFCTFVKNLICLNTFCYQTSKNCSCLTSSSLAVFIGYT